MDKIIELKFDGNRPLEEFVTRNDYVVKNCYMPTPQEEKQDYLVYHCLITFVDWTTNTACVLVADYWNVL
jgi:hypothetical protein